LSHSIDSGAHFDCKPEAVRSGFSGCLEGGKPDASGFSYTGQHRAFCGSGRRTRPGAGWSELESYAAAIGAGLYLARPEDARAFSTQPVTAAAITSGRPLHGWQKPLQRPWAVSVLIPARRQHGCVVVALIPARPDSNYWHDCVAGHTDVFMLRGRLKFGDGANSAPFPSCVAVWGADRNRIARLSLALTNAWHVPRHRPMLVEDSEPILLTA
jgi:hypothetical protein